MLWKDWKSAIKKTLFHTKADEKQRTSFKERIAVYESAGLDIVYVDESRDYSLTAVDENYHVLLFVFFINDIIQSRLFLR